MKRIDVNAKERIQSQILTLVQQGITNVEQLHERLRKTDKQFEQRLFYPALSGLNRMNQLCWHWKYSDERPPEKHFFLTFEGERTLNKQKVSC